ncbi:MAG: hypothetical protein ABIK93_01580 [candidate division WOR-3 bacterium]
MAIRKHYIGSLIKRIEAIQSELEELKKKLIPQKNKIKIEGLWAGWRVPNELIEEAKRKIFRDAYNQ